MKSITLQPSEYTDQITDDGTELQKLPYPFHVTPDGSVLRQDFWRGRVLSIVGFVADASAMRVDVWWDDYAIEAAIGLQDQVLGMYVIAEDSKGDWSTYQSAISRVTVNEEPEGGGSDGK